MLKYSNRIDLEKDLSNGTYFSSNKLRIYLLRSGIKECKCESCGLKEWLGRTIPLELHHIDGDRYNNRISNLQILCSNCHSITDGFRSKKRQPIDLTRLSQIVPECTTYKEVFLKLNLNIRGITYIKVRKEIDRLGLKLKPKPPKALKKINEDRAINADKPKCYISAKSNWYPTDQELFNAVWNTPVLKLGKKYGVTGNSIKHRCTRRNIPVPPPGYWAKLQAGKVEECTIIYAAAQKSFQDALLSSP